MIIVPDSTKFSPMTPSPMGSIHPLSRSNGARRDSAHISQNWYIYTSAREAMWHRVQAEHGQ
jgi:hypothetical protein